LLYASPYVGFYGMFNCWKCCKWAWLKQCYWFYPGVTEFLCQQLGTLVIAQNLFGLISPDLLDLCCISVPLLQPSWCWGAKSNVSSRSTVVSPLSAERRKYRLTDEHEPWHGSRPGCCWIDSHRADWLFFPASIWASLCSLLAVGVMLMVTGGILWWPGSDGGMNDCRKVSLVDALIVGLVQACDCTGHFTIRRHHFLWIAEKVQEDFPFNFPFCFPFPLLSGQWSWSGKHRCSSGNCCGACGDSDRGSGGIPLFAFLRSVVQQGHLYFFSPYCWAAGSATVVLSFMLR